MRIDRLTVQNFKKFAKQTFVLHGSGEELILLDGQPQAQIADESIQAM